MYPGDDDGRADKSPLPAGAGILGAVIPSPRPEEEAASEPGFPLRATSSRGAPGPETSGTAFFTYGLLWGINNGYLKEKTYLPAALKGWEYLSTTALQSSGKIGYIQPIGEKAIPGQVVDANSTANFGVGAFLLAASEMVKFVK